jgi:hypothetical protein
VAIVKAPLKSDPAGKCSRWRVILYNPATHKQEWHTVRGTEAAAKVFQRDQETRLSKGTYIAKAERRTFEQVADMFMKESAGPQSANQHDRRLPESARLPLNAGG